MKKAVAQDSQDPYVNKNRSRQVDVPKMSLTSSQNSQQVHSHSRGGQQDQKRMTQVTGITFNPLSQGGVSPHQQNNVTA